MSRTVASCLVAAAASLTASAALAQSLQPFQQEALDKILATVEPELRPMLRTQLQGTLAMLNREQVEMMLESMLAGSEETLVEEPPESAPVSEEDLAYNRAQWEPVVRDLWQAGKAFDDFVAAKLAEHCSRDREFAVFGQAWRHEVHPLDPSWPKVSANPDLDVEILGASYAPQDGRYDFDFADVKLDFDRAATEAAIADACAEFVEIGESFLAEARAGVVDDYLPNGMQIEGSANAKAGAVRQRLEAALQAQAPGGNYAVFTALINGRRVE